MTVPAVDELRFVAVGQEDPLAEPLLAELAVEYAGRYGGTEQRVMKWLRQEYPAEDFTPPDGGSADRPSRRLPVTGGGFGDSTTPGPSSSGSGPTAVTGSRATRRPWWPNSNAEIAARGYRRVYLTTGDRQPEAEALYLSSGYTRLPAPLPTAGGDYPIAFEKTLR